MSARTLAILTAALVAATPAADPGAGAAGAAAIRFTAVDGSAGIDLKMTSGAMPSREILEVDGGGVALFDFDRDGDLDVFLANGATLEAPERGPGSRLYANRGDGTFEDVTERTGIELTRWAMGVAVGDYDGDGWDDLYVTCFGPNVLLRNRDGRRFDDVSSTAGVADARWSTSAAFADLDGDGDLDLYVANYLAFDPAKPPDRSGKAYRGVPVMAGPRGLEGQPDTLYENLGRGRFREVALPAARGGTGSDYGLSVRVFDHDGDGRLDVFVGNDSTPDRLYRNLGGLRFEEVGLRAGLSTDGMGDPQATMGTCLADVDGNGRLDLYVTVFSDDANTLLVDLGGGLFDDRSARFGLGAPSRPHLGWGCGFYDFDLDGDEDLLVANGHVYPQMEDPEVGGAWAQQPLILERRGDRFETACSGTWCERAYHGRATAFGDLDGDRDVDVVMTTLNGPVVVLRNEAPTARRSLVVRLEGPPGNPRGIGSVVELETAAGIQRRWIGGGGSYQSVDAPEAYFGLGDAAGPVTVRVRWPGGEVSELDGVELDRTVMVPWSAPDSGSRGGPGRGVAGFAAE